MKTIFEKPASVERKWYVIDAEGVALYLMSSYIGVRTLMVENSPSARKYRFMAQLKHYFKSIEVKQSAF